MHHWTTKSNIISTALALRYREVQGSEWLISVESDTPLFPWLDYCIHGLKIPDSYGAKLTFALRKVYVTFYSNNRTCGSVMLLNRWNVPLSQRVLQAVYQHDFCICGKFLFSSDILAAIRDWLKSPVFGQLLKSNENWNENMVDVGGGGPWRCKNRGRLGVLGAFCVVGDCSVLSWSKKPWAPFVNPSLFMSASYTLPKELLKTCAEYTSFQQFFSESVLTCK